MNPRKLIKIIGLNILLIPNIATAASDSRISFHNIDTVDDLLALPASELCLHGGPTSDNIKLILLHGPLAQSMYQKDPTTARMMIDEQSKKIQSRIKEKCALNSNTSSRKITKEMIKDENLMCRSGAPTKDELKTYIMQSPEIDIDKQLQTIPYQYRLMMEEGAKLKGYTLREVFIEDIVTATAKNWQETCNKKNNYNTKNSSSNPSKAQQSYDEVDKELNSLWKRLNPETRKRLLPSQREWIKNKSSCNNEKKCLTDMTNNRIRELESESDK
ncbi:lysozyme inhibitor LprI family protein [Atlantibacter subterranea]|uniref:Lysozyme inhibitor LprI family protein n=1 Tax=Atlantibacter subterraneus TaxID=255519 RepID=A0ABU4DXF2_9ENTR|nr:lysozyme inhibitor LprI family protein [Atlantibacter subterranea]MDV7021546.1 lysozyme inhibitor LprI family protein [Atlantibacter subterranea]MDZ5664356.1 lysozyme inhibitor LprI family protein [Atlantibacter hermannii]